MRYSAETFLEHAEECGRRAEAATDRQLKALFTVLANQWRELASTVRQIEADRKEIDSFFKRRAG